MRSSLITLLLAPVAVLSLTTIVGENTTGPQCCDKGTPDPSKHCSSIGLNAYCVGFLFQVRPRGKKQRDKSINKNFHSAPPIEMTRGVVATL